MVFVLSNTISHSHSLFHLKSLLKEVDKDRVSINMFSSGIISIEIVFSSFFSSF